MSLSDRLKNGRPTTTQETAPLTRSLSFGSTGLLQQHRRTTSAPDGNLPKAGHVLGQSHSPSASRHLLQGISATWSGKPPPLPRPQKVLPIFHSVEKGLRECVQLTRKDIENWRSSVDSLSVNSSQSQGRLYELEKQLKTAERYLKRLEYHQSKLEELKEHYEVQQRMREGVRTMHYAYVLCPGKERDTAINSVRSGLKECTETLCALEADLERMMGTLLFQMKGIQGFARLCAGDVFEITVKHGEQKWKSRGRIQKSDKQVWDHQKAIFKALLGESLFIKAVEVKTLGKKVVLGNKYCETKDLFSAHPQLMTVNLNPSGSLKLHVVVTWNPLHGCPEDTVPKPPSSLLVALASPSLKRRMKLEQEKQTGTVEMRSPDSLSCKSLDSGSSSGGVSSLPETPGSSPAPPLPVRTNATVHSEDRTKRWSGDNSDYYSSSVDLGSHLGGNELQEVIHNLVSTLEDIQGQYPELNSLEQHVMELEKLIKRSSSRRGSTGSSISISVESALGCFDFLNSAIDDCEYSDERITEDKSLDPDLTAKTSDSGIASLARQLMDDEIPSSVGASPQPPSTGNEQLDLALVTHLNYCRHLLEMLGSFGPLKCKEIYSLDKLRRQSTAVGILLKVAATAREERRSLSGASLLPEGSEARRLWELLTGGEPLCITAEHLMHPLQQVIEPHSSGPLHPSDVARLFLRRVLDIERFESDAVVTVLQLQVHISRVGASIGSHLRQLTQEVGLMEALHSPDTVVIKKTLAAMKGFVPPKEPLLCVGRMLVSEDPIVLKAAETYLKTSEASMEKQLLTTFLEGLESESPLTRQGSCAAMSVLQATEYADQLVFLCYADESFKVRQQAKDTLFSFGDAGRKAYEQSQLFAHGFQGLSMK